MQQSFNEEVFNRQVQREHYTMRLAVNNSNNANKIIKESDKPAISIFNKNIEEIKQKKLDGLNDKKLDKEIRELSDKIAKQRSDAFDEALDGLNESIDRFITNESKYQGKIYNDTSESLLGQYGLAMVFALPLINDVRKAYNTTLASVSVGTSVYLPDAIDNIPLRENQRVYDTLRAGVHSGEANAVIRSSLIKQFGITNRAVYGYSRTANTAISDHATTSLGQQNSGFLRGWRNVSIIDGRTSSICLMASAKYGKRVYVRKSSISPVPRHMSCRSRIQAVIMDYSNLGFALIAGSVVVTQDTGQSAAEKQLILESGGLSASGITGVKNVLTKEINDSNLEIVLNNSTDEFLRDFFQSEAAWLAFIAGTLTFEELFDKEDKMPLTEEEIDAKVGGD